MDGTFRRKLLEKCLIRKLKPWRSWHGFLNFSFLDVWMFGIHARDCFQVFAHSHMKWLWYSIGLWMAALFPDSLMIQVCSDSAVLHTMHRIRFGTDDFVPMPYLFRDEQMIERLSEAICAVFSVTSSHWLWHVLARSIEISNHSHVKWLWTSIGLWTVAMFLDRLLIQGCCSA